MVLTRCSIKMQILVHRVVSCWRTLSEHWLMHAVHPTVSLLIDITWMHTKEKNKYTPISKNVVGENGEWQEIARPKGTVVSMLMSSSRGAKLGSLSKHDDDSYTNSTNLHIWQWKTVFLHALHVHFSSFDILKTFSFFLWREMTFLQLCGRREHIMTNVQFCLVPSAGFNLNPG